MKIRFHLKGLLVLIGLLAIALALVTQIGMGTAEFEVCENNLRLDENGLVKGSLLLRYEGDEYAGTTWPYECKLNNIDRQELLGLKLGLKQRVRYRMAALGPLKKQDPCAIFLTRRLRIQPLEIVGFVTYQGETEVVINGQR